MFKYMKQTFLELKREIHNDKIILPDYNMPLGKMDRESVQSAKKQRN